MHSRVNLFNMNLPSYGVVVTTGVVIVFILGIVISWYRKISIHDYVRLFLCGGIAALIGAKCWYMLVNDFYSGEWIITIERFKESGYSFYGGLFLGLITVFLVAKKNKIDFENISRYLFFLIPLLHAIWKIGCYMGGCCFGIKYSGIGAIVFPEGVMAPAGIKLFPAQLLESVVLFAFSIVFWFAGIKKMTNIVLKYLMCYASMRFVIDFFRESKKHYFFSVSQWMSLLVIVFVLTSFFMSKKEKVGGAESE